MAAIVACAIVQSEELNQVSGGATGERCGSFGSSSCCQAHARGGVREGSGEVPLGNVGGAPLQRLGVLLLAFDVPPRDVDDAIHAKCNNVAKLLPPAFAVKVRFVPRRLARVYVHPSVQA